MVEIEQEQLAEQVEVLEVDQQSQVELVDLVLLIKVILVVIYHLIAKDMPLVVEGPMDLV